MVYLEKITNKLLRGEKLVHNEINKMKILDDKYIINSFLCGTPQKKYSKNNIWNV